MDDNVVWVTRDRQLVGVVRIHDAQPDRKGRGPVALERILVEEAGKHRARVARGGSTSRPPLGNHPGTEPNWQAMDATLDLVRRLAAADHGLAVAVTIRPEGTPQTSVVNAGVLHHPLRDEPVVAFVGRGGTVKLRNLRERPPISLVFRAGWEWAAVEGDAQLVGPDDPMEGMGPDDVRLLLRAIFTAAGGRHDDFDEYDRVMATERRTAVLVPPTRITTNPARARHIDRS